MSSRWSEEELKAAVEAYVEMNRKQSLGLECIKSDYYHKLHLAFGRTPESYEYRMQNISHVFEIQGRRWVKGLMPKRNVGSNVIELLEKIIAEVEGQELGTNAGFQARISKAKPKTNEPPSGNQTPTTQLTSVSQFLRDPDVVAWVLHNAAGNCEVCGSPAPFKRTDGTPFLEVHHIIRLADGGPDTINNAVAACPNCHRRLHHGLDREQLVNSLRTRLKRVSDQ